MFSTWSLLSNRQHISPLPQIPPRHIRLLKHRSLYLYFYISLSLSLIHQATHIPPPSNPSKAYDKVSANTASSVPKTSKKAFLRYFFAQNRFSRPNGQCLPIHTIHILKAIVPAVNLAYLDSLYVHPVIRPNFCKRKLSASGVSA